MALWREAKFVRNPLDWDGIIYIVNRFPGMEVLG
jgi:hypothetical protein